MLRHEWFSLFWLNDLVGNRSAGINIQLAANMQSPTNRSTDFRFSQLGAGCHGLSPCPVTVTTRIVTFLVGDPCKPSFATVTGRGGHPTHSHTHTHTRTEKATAFSVGKDPLVDFSTPQEIGTFSVRFVLVHSGVQQMSHLEKKQGDNNDGSLKVSGKYEKYSESWCVCVFQKNERQYCEYKPEGFVGIRRDSFIPNKWAAPCAW